MNKKIGIVWLRNDFRILKNDALAYATQNHDHVCALYIFKKKDFIKRSAQLWWLYHSLKNFKKKLNQFNINLEIICIPNWSLKKVKSKVDKFHNCASFQEMTIEQVENYKLLITKILNKNLISLLFYKGWKDNNTLSPDSVNNIFNKSLKMKEFTDIAGSDPVDLVYLTSI